MHLSEYYSVQFFGPGELLSSLCASQPYLGSVWQLHICATAKKNNKLFFLLTSLYLRVPAIFVKLALDTLGHPLNSFHMSTQISRSWLMMTWGAASCLNIQFIASIPNVVTINLTFLKMNTVIILDMRKIRCSVLGVSWYKAKSDQTYSYF